MFQLFRMVGIRRMIAGLAAGTASLLAATTARANLGSFETQDGYADFLNEVTQYNEGEYGTNNGGPGGSQVPITPGTGLWYGISGVRYPSFCVNGGTSYATGHSGYQHTGAKALVVTTNCEGWGGPTLKYGYRVDSRDLNGISPAATAGQQVNISFWTRPYMQGTGEGGGVTPGTIGDSVSFVDSLGNVGFSVGVEQPGTTSDYVTFNNTGSYTSTAIVSVPFVYSRWDIKLDLLNQTVTAGYYDGATTNYSVLLSSAPLAMSMADLDRLYFESTSGVSNSKNWAVDDFVFSATPEPSTLALLLGVAGLVVRRRRR